MHFSTTEMFYLTRTVGNMKAAVSSSSDPSLPPTVRATSNYRLHLSTSCNNYPPCSFTGGGGGLLFILFHQSLHNQYSKVFLHFVEFCCENCISMIITTLFLTFFCHYISLDYIFLISYHVFVITSTEKCMIGATPSSLVLVYTNNTLYSSQLFLTN